MINDILVTVVIVVYNHEKFLKETIESVLNQQTNFNYEILIADDCSTDNSSEIIKQYQSEYPDKIRAIYRTNNIGAQKNIIDSYLQSKGKYIAHLDGDDLMLQNKLQTQIEFFRSHTNCSLVHHKMRAFDSNTGKTLHYLSFKNRNCIYNLNELLLCGNVIAHSSKMVDTTKFHRELLKPHKNCRAVDYLFNVVTVNNYDIGYIDEILGEYRVHDNQLTKTNIKQQWRFYAGYMRAISAARKYNIDNTTIKIAKSKTLLTFAKIYLDAKCYRKFKKLIEKSIKLNKNLSLSTKFHYYLRFTPKILLTIRKIIAFTYKLQLRLFEK